MQETIWWSETFSDPLRLMPTVPEVSAVNVALSLLLVPLQLDWKGEDGASDGVADAHRALVAGLGDHQSGGVRLEVQQPPVQIMLEWAKIDVFRAPTLKAECAVHPLR
ncbi:hypothetical protein OG604_00875 [Streptomyces sp. NBC_01231]|nr:hypothetical protein OG604_00875 [Streptomyces sp. NBC_01231]